MTLDEAIKHAEEVAEEKEIDAENQDPLFPNDIEECKKCVEEHRQLAEWLKDYKRLKEQEPCKDAISRQSVLNEIPVLWNSNGDKDYCMESLRDFVAELPPVIPQPKIGRWIYDYMSADGHRTYHCSECGCFLKPKHSEPLNSFKWCSLCGAKMVEPQESEEV